MSGKIVVTVRMDDFQRDLELPDGTPLRSLCAELLTLLRQTDARLFSDTAELVLAADGMPMLSGGASLSDYGVGSGAYLDIVPVERRNIEKGGKQDG